MNLQEILTHFSVYIERELGIVYSEHNFFQLQNRLEEIGKSVGEPCMERLCKLLLSGEFEKHKQLLLDLSTNNETSFFRDCRVFEAIEKHLLQNHSGEEMRIWSAGCSSGQEVYSMAILIEEFCRKNKLNIKYSLVGTDVSERILLKAKEGFYNKFEVGRGLQEEILTRYFRPVGDEKWQVCNELKERTQFRHLNLKDAFNFPELFHLVLCRNVLIYQNVDGKKDILNRIADTLVTSGNLILGSGESLIGLSNKFHQRMKEGAVIYEKRETVNDLQIC